MPHPFWRIRVSHEAGLQWTQRCRPPGTTGKVPVAPVHARGGDGFYGPVWLGNIHWIALPGWLLAHLVVCLVICLVIYPMVWGASFARFVEFSEQVGHLYRSLSSFGSLLAHARQSLVVGIGSEYGVDNRNACVELHRGNSACRLIRHDFEMIGLPAYDSAQGYQRIKLIR